MRSLRVRSARMLLLATLLAMLLPTRASVGRGASIPAVSVVSPPPLISVPLGQALEVRYRAAAPAARLELWEDDLCLFDDPVVPGQEITHTWAPTELRAHHLIVYARDAGGRMLAGDERTILGLPPGSPAWVHMAANPIPDLSNVFRLSLASQCIPRGGKP